MHVVCGSKRRALVASDTPGQGQGSPDSSPTQQSKQTMAATNVKQDKDHDSDSDSPARGLAAGGGRSPIVSVLIPGEDTDKFLLKCFKDRGWWLPFGKVGRTENIKTAAQRVASEVSVNRDI